MTDGVRARVAGRLGVAPSRLAALDQFAEADLDRLHAAVVDAIDRQTRELDIALERSLSFIPALLRGRARKLLFGDSGRG